MHLNDEQLLEPNQQEQQHLAACEECQLRANNVALVRQSLQAMPELAPPSLAWQQIKENIDSHNKPENKIVRLFKWQGINPALAASIFALAIFYFVNENVSKLADKESEIALLIKQNQEIQQTLFQLLEQREQTEQTLATIQYKLNRYDEKIQKAYLQQASEQELTKLWSQRAQALEQLQTKNQQRNLQKI